MITAKQKSRSIISGVVMVLIALFAAVLSLIFALLLVVRVLSQPSGTTEMKRIAKAIQEGSNAFIGRQYKTITAFTIILAAVLYVAIGWIAAASFVLGAFLSALAGYIGLAISVRANVRTAAAAKKGLLQALRVSFNGGAVNGFAIVGLGLLGVSSLYLAFGNPELIVGFAFGASLVSLFARVGGGIYTKAADVGADLVGKIEKGIPEDDLRNPAVIADNVGDNVGDCAGMGADLFESYVVTLIAAMLLGTLLFGAASAQVLYPLLVGGVGVIAAIIGTFVVRTNNTEGIWGALSRGLLLTALLSAIGFYFVGQQLGLGMGVFYATLSGLVATLLITYITEHYTGRDKGPVYEIAEASQTGPATNIIAGLAVGMRSTFWPVLVIAGAILVSFYFGGLYGIAMASVGLLSVTAMVMSIDSFGPISDNAGGIAEMSKAPPKTREITDALDAIGNTTKATTKGIAIASAALSALALFAAFVQSVGLQSIDILKTDILVGLLIGAMVPFYFSSMCMKAVGKAAFSIVNEVRRQFKEIKGIMSRKAKPEYDTCVDICTRGALRQLVGPGLLAVLSPIVVGFILGPGALAGFIAGSIASGLMLALFLSNAGAAWDNAKKYIEIGNFGGKGSDAHKAAVIGDTVGDPSKDTAGPAINPLIKVINTLALVLASLFLTWHLIVI